MGKKKNPLTPNEIQQVKMLPKIMHETLFNLYKIVQHYYFTSYPQIGFAFEIFSDPIKSQKLGFVPNFSRIYMHYQINNIIPKMQKEMKKMVVNNPNFPFANHIMSRLPGIESSSIYATKFKQFLGNQQKLNQFILKRKEISKRYPYWEKTLSDSFLRVMNNPLNLIQKHNNLIKIEWSIAIDSYIHDFELIIQYFIDLLIPDLLKKKIDSYSKKIHFFFQDDTKLINKYQHTIIKPYFRTLLAHQWYYYDYIKEEFVFLRKIENQEHPKTLSIKECIDLCRNINILVNCLILLYLQEYDKDDFTRNIKSEFTNQFNQMYDIYSKTNLMKHPIYQELSKIKGITIDFQKTHNIWNQMVESDKLHLYSLITDSFIMFQTYNGVSKPKPDFIMNAAFRTIYLANYYLTYKKLLQPLYEIFNPLSPQHHIPESKIFEFCDTLNDGKFKELYSDLNVDNRNAIAHRNPEIHQNHSFNVLLSKNMAYRMALETILEPEKKNLGLSYGIGELWYNLFEPVDKRWNDSIKREIHYLKKYPEYKNLQIVFSLLYTLVDLQYIDVDNILSQKLETINNKMKSWNEQEIDHFWISILYWIEKQNLKNKYEIFNLLSTKIQSHPSTLNPYREFLAYQIMFAYQKHNYHEVKKFINKLVKLCSNVNQ